VLINTRQIMIFETDALYSSHLHKINAVIESINVQMKYTENTDNTLTISHECNYLINQSHGSCFNAFRGVVLVKTIS